MTRHKTFALLENSPHVRFRQHVSLYQHLKPHFCLVQFLECDPKKEFLAAAEVRR
jgi:hypothetical protein